MYYVLIHETHFLDHEGLYDTHSVYKVLRGRRLLKHYENQGYELNHKLKHNCPALQMFKEWS